MDDRRGPFQVCASGRRWYPLDPRPEDFYIEDIAHHLAMICRYGGAPRYFYSVAEHSVLVSRHVHPGIALEGLLHDAAEAVVGDTIKPLKDLAGWDEFRRIEALNHDAIAERFHLDWDLEIEAEVSRVDKALVIDEVLELIEGGAEYLRLKGYRVDDALGADIAAFSPERAEVAFLVRYQQLVVERGAE
jgi:5'-deoxynucleotidase YfbR-like HD superfamily hydrolase